MKVKIAFGLTLCCLMSCLAGIIITDRVDAQAAPYPVVSGWPFSVNFVEDPFRMHGLQIHGIYHSIPDKVNTPVYTVPNQKKFIVTDIIMDNDAHLVLEDGTVNRLGIDMNDSNARMIGFRSGLVFSQEVKVYQDSGGLNAITLSGYLVDL